MVLVAIAAVLATAIGFSSAMAARRATTVFGADQSLLAGEGGEAMAAYVLRLSTTGTTAVTDVIKDLRHLQPAGAPRVRGISGSRRPAAAQTTR